MVIEFLFVIEAITGYIETLLNTGRKFWGMIELPLLLRDRLVAGRLSLEQKAVVRIHLPRPENTP